MKRSHSVVITVTFDKRITAKDAVAEVRDNIHGQFWTSMPAGLAGFKSYPETFKVGAVSSHARKRKA